MLSPEAQKAERTRYVDEAQETAKGCVTHFGGSGLRLRKNGKIVPPEDVELFQYFMSQLTSRDTSPQAFDQIIDDFRARFPLAKGWISWWLRPANASMIFPAKSRMDVELVDQIPNTSNPVEHQHSLLHRSNGIDQDLIPGIKKLHLYIEKIHDEYQAIKGALFCYLQIYL